VGSFGIGSNPNSVYVSGRYAYVVDAGSNDLKVIDVSDPTAPSQVGRLIIGSNPKSVYVSGRYAYVVDWGSNDLKVIDISGAEVTSLIAHSLEAGNLQVRNDMIAQGQLQVSGGLNVGAGGIFSDGNVGISGTIAIANDIAPTASLANLVQLYAADDSGSSELWVRDEAGNASVISPHNFSLIGQPSEPMAWSFYSENDHGKINVDMLRTIRLVEEMSGEKLVHTESIGSLGLEATGKAEAVFPELVGTDSRGYKFVHYQKLVAPLIEAVKEIKGEHALLRADHEAIDRRLAVLEKRLR
jgi:YVTN family beta-propeller protein